MLKHLNNKKCSTVMSYYGSKYMLAPKYPAPQHDTIIEPFAGGAGYSLHYPAHNVKLYDLNEDVCSVWDYMINADPDEIRKLPMLEQNQSIDELEGLTKGQKNLIGWWVQYGVGVSKKKYTNTTWKKRIKNNSTVWCERRREMLAQTSARIKHWTITNCSYHDIPDQEVTWFIDPPYKCKAGRRYRHHQIDFEHLAEWCQSRSGQVMVCENNNSEAWLPFVPFATTHGVSKKTTEVIWANFPLESSAQLDLFNVDINKGGN